MNESMLILVTVLRAIGTSACLALAGVVVTRMGFITDAGRKSLAEISMNLLMPCLLFKNMIDCDPGSECNPVAEIVEKCWILLLFPLIVVGSGLALGKLVAVVTGCPANFNKACVGAVAFANSTGMSITLLEVLSPTLILSGIVTQDPLKVLPVYLLLYPMLQWTIGSYLFGLIGGSSEPETEPSQPIQKQSTRMSRVSHTSTLHRALSIDLPDMDLATEPDFYPCDQDSHHCEMRKLRTEPAAVTRRATVGGDVEANGGACCETEESCGRRASAPPMMTSNAAGSSDDNDNSEASSAALEPSDDAGPEKGSRRGACRAGFKTVRKVIRNALVPPVIGSALGLIVALIRPLQALFVDLSGDGGAAPLSFLFQAIHTIGGASVPINMLVLGSNLAKGANLRAVPLSTNFGILFMKNVGQPVMISLVIAGLSRVFENDLSVWLVAMIVSCTPTANNIMVMVELSGQNKAGVSAIIFTQYMAAPFVLTAVISLFLLNKDLLVPGLPA